MKREKRTRAKLIAHIVVVLVIVGIIIGVALGGDSFVTYIKQMHGM